MPLYDDRTQETSTSTGTGNFVLAGAVTGYQSFASALNDGDRCTYCITDGTNWEVGDGTWTNAGGLARENVYSSSNSDALVNFPAGTKQVFLTEPAVTISTIGMSIATQSLFLNP